MKIKKELWGLGSVWGGGGRVGGVRVDVNEKFRGSWGAGWGSGGCE